MRKTQRRGRLSKPIGVENRKTTLLIEQATAILEDEQSMTIRQLFYRVVSRGVVENVDAQYKRVSRVMTEPRSASTQVCTAEGKRSEASLPAYQGTVTGRGVWLSTEQFWQRRTL